MDSLSWRDGARKRGDKKKAGVQETTCQRRESCMGERELRNRRSPLTIQQSTDKHRDVRKILEAEEEPFKSMRGKSDWRGRRALVVPTSQAGKPHNS